MEFEVRVGAAEIIKQGSELRVRDPYKDVVYRVEKNSTVDLIPVPPLHVPAKITNCLYLKLVRPLVISKGGEFWVKAPYELAVTVDGTVVDVVTPFRVKYALHGDVIDGVICRYFETDVFDEIPSEGFEALMKVVFEKTPSATLYSYIVVPIEGADIFEYEGRYFFETVKVRKEAAGIFGYPTKSPPVEGAWKIQRVPRI